MPEFERVFIHNMPDLRIIKNLMSRLDLESLRHCLKVPEGKKKISEYLFSCRTTTHDGEYN